MDKKLKNLSFSAFLDYFPEIELPVTITEQSIGAFSTKNKPFPEIAPKKYLAPFHKEGDDDLTEYVPCLKLPETHDFHGIIYWRARLLEYGYYLATYDKRGRPISHRRIAGTFEDKGQILRMVATIDPDWIIYIIVGKTSASDKSYNPLASRTFNLELLATGEIISS